MVCGGWARSKMAMLEKFSRNLVAVGEDRERNGESFYHERVHR